MTTKEINKSIKSMKIHLKGGEKIEHWFNFFFLLIPLGFVGFITIYEPISNGEIPISGTIVIGLFFLFLRHKLISPKLEVYKSTLTEEQFKQANKAAAKLNEWIILSNRKNYFSAIKGTNWQQDGIKITAILKNGKLYLNSMVNPSTNSNPFTFGINKKNKFELIRQYQLILNGENVIEDVDNELKKREAKFWEESEWTMGNILMRITGYGLTSIFLLIGILFVCEGTWEGLIPIILSIGMSLTYIKTDIKILKEKSRRKKLKGKEKSTQY